MGLARCPKHTANLIYGYLILKEGKNPRCPKHTANPIYGYLIFKEGKKSKMSQTYSQPHLWLSNTEGDEP
jgi:hypothetical protein